MCKQQAEKLLSEKYSQFFMNYSVNQPSPYLKEGKVVTKPTIIWDFMLLFEELEAKKQVCTSQSRNMLFAPAPAYRHSSCSKQPRNYMLSERLTVELTLFPHYASASAST